MKYFNILFSSFLLQSSTFAQSLDDVFKRADKAHSRTVQNVGGSVHSDMNAAVNSLKDKVAVGDERISTLNASSSSSTGITNSNSVRVVSIRNEAYDNAGRKTEGYWVECQGGRKTRVYRTAWDSSKDWFSPNGLGTKNFIAKESISINDVAQSICR